MKRHLLIAVMALAAPVAMLGFSSSALATEHHPTGKFAPFKDCPLGNAAVEQCVYAETTSGEFTVGKKTVAINKPIILQGGTIENEEGELTFVGAENGETLSKTSLVVPGGLLGIKAPESWPTWLQEIFNNFINEGFTGVKETTELAKPASSIKLNQENLLFQKGTALELPVKVKLENVFLGSGCYVGSEANPVVLKLTTGATAPPEKGTPNKPIKGFPGELKIEEKGELVRLVGGSLVDNTFSAPEATGCGGLVSFLVDPLVDSILGVPAESGYNTAILNGNLEKAYAPAVKASE
jgi:hypothetical protein